MTGARAQSQRVRGVTSHNTQASSHHMSSVVTNMAGVMMSSAEISGVA